MARKARSLSSTTAIKRPNRRRRPIAEPFQVVSSATVKSDGKHIRVPMLVLYGEWLQVLGFPIGAAAYVTTDAHGELALHRLGLAVPRRVRVRALPS